MMTRSMIMALLLGALAGLGGVASSADAAPAASSPANAAPTRPAPANAAPIRRAPVRPAPPRPAATPAPAVVTADAGKLAAALTQLGTRVLAAIPPPQPSFDAGAKAGDILAIQPCTRPTAAERTALTRRIARATPGALDLVLRFGCKEPARTILDVAFDRPPEAHRTGVWRVVRASETELTTLAESTGTSNQDWMEWVNEVALNVLALVDLDGDGALDAVLAQDSHEGGSQHHDIALSLWSSKTGKRTALGTMSDEVTLAARQPADARPLVVRVEPREAGGEIARLQYRCIEPAGKLTICPAVEPARRFDRALEIAHGFVAGHAYGPHELAVPDRALLAELLLPLAAFGVTAVEAEHLRALAAPAAPEVAIAREVDRVRTRADSRYHGELELLHDHRPDQLRTMLGDAACPAAAPAAIKAAARRLATWIAASDARVLVEQGACTAGADCGWKHPEEAAVEAACVAGAQAYYHATWSYADPGTGERLSRAGLFHDRAGRLSLVTSASLAGPDVPRDCPACGPRAEPELVVSLFRHGPALVAIALGPPDATSRSLSVNVDGVAVPVAAPAGAVGWQVFCGVRFSAPVTASNVVRVEGAHGELAYFHWDKAWTQLAAFPRPGPMSASPKLDGAAQWLWNEDRKDAALLVVEQLDAERWTRDAGYRAELQQALVLTGADPASLARATAAAAALTAPARP